MSRVNPAFYKLGEAPADPYGPEFRNTLVLEMNGWISGMIVLHYTL